MFRSDPQQFAELLAEFTVTWNVDVSLVHQVVDRDRREVHRTVDNMTKGRTEA